MTFTVDEPAGHWARVTMIRMNFLSDQLIGSWKGCGIGVLGLVFLLAAIPGCVTIGPASISNGRAAYNAVINRTEDEQVLAMIVGQRYDETYGMLVVSNVTASLRGTAKVGANVGFGPSRDYDGNLVPFSTEATYEENPTITYIPLRGEQFVQRMLAPLSAEQVLLLSRMSSREIEVLRLLVRRANGLVNPLYGAHRGNDQFDRFIDLFAELRDNGDLDIVESAKGQFTLVLHDYSAEQSETINELLELLRVPQRARPAPGPTTLPLRFLMGSPQGGVVDWETPSALEVLDTVAAGVDVPLEHLEKRWARSDFGNPPRRLITVHSSRQRPSEASVAIFHRGWWFYIDGRDSQSKKGFVILRTLIGMRLDAATPAQAAPVLTLPVGR